MGKITKKARIAILMNSFWNNGAGMSGSDQRACQIAKRFNDYYIVDFYTSCAGKMFLDKKINCIVSDASLDKGNIYKCYIKRTLWLNKKLKENYYDIIYSTSDFFPDTIPAFIYRKKHKKTKWIQVIHHVYSNWRSRPGKRLIALVGALIQKISFKLIKNRASLVFVVSSHVQKDLQKKFSINGKISPNGVDSVFFDKINKNKSFLQASFLARLNPTKGIFDLVPIWARVVSDIPKAQLRIIGGGTEQIKQELKKRFKDAGLEKNIELCGYLEDEDAFSIVKSSCVFVFPSHEEGWGMAIAESMACGTPVISWNLPVYKTVFGDNIIQASMDDIDGFAKATIKLMSDHRFNNAVSKKAYEYVKRYSWDSIAKNERNLIEKHD